MAEPYEVAAYGGSYYGAQPHAAVAVYTSAPIHKLGSYTPIIVKKVTQ